MKCLFKEQEYELVRSNRKYLDGIGLLKDGDDNTYASIDRLGIVRTDPDTIVGTYNQIILKGEEE